MAESVTNKAILFRMIAALILCMPSSSFAQQPHTVARLWNEALLAAIRLDQARPTVHARNLFHLSVAMWDAWAAYDSDFAQVIHHERASAQSIGSARHQAISYAAYRLLKWRFRRSPNVAQTDTALNRLMESLGYDKNDTSLEGAGAIALGNRIAQSVIEYGLGDGANEVEDYTNRHYLPVNPRLDPAASGNPRIVDPDRWQQMDLPNFVGQSGQRAENYPPFVGPEWGWVKPFSLTDDDITWYQRNGQRWPVYLDAGAPPRIAGSDTDKSRYRRGFEQVIAYGSKLDAGDGSLIDVSPESRGNNSLGTNDGKGHRRNPATGAPYAPQLVAAGDYYRVLAEFWADGPSSETPPGHWFTIFNIVADQPATSRQYGNDGVELERLEWDLRGYLTLGGAMHDAAVAAWSNKGWYDFVRPVSAIRYLCDLGQASDPMLPNFNPDGINLQPGIIEVITEESAGPNGRHHHLASDEPGVIGHIAIKSWRGPEYIDDPDEDTAGVGWIMCGDWWPYQRPNFVTPPFAAYVSGHSTFSRAAAEVMTLITGSAFFPGGLGIFNIPANRYLVFERGPSRSLRLMWATYQDAADESGLSRLYGGIHHPADDIAGRKMGYKVGHRAFAKARTYFP